MTKNILLLLISVFILTLCNAQDTAAIVAKSQIIKASADEIAEADKNTKEFISGIDEAASFFERFVFVGPKLWDKIKDLPAFKEIKQGNLTIRVPKFEKDGSWKKTMELTGKMFQSPDEYKNLLDYLQSTFIISKAAVADLNVTDKFIYWLYFAKIEQGARAIQCDKARLMIHFVKNKLFFIELTSE